jgi:hypothetical protein
LRRNVFLAAARRGVADDGDVFQASHAVILQS